MGLFHKRLKRQWFFGVCRGLAEASGLSVWVLRAVFILLLFGGKIGGSLPCPCTCSSTCHSRSIQDCRLLLRFKFKRWRENRGMQG